MRNDDSSINIAAAQTKTATPASPSCPSCRPPAAVAAAHCHAPHPPLLPLRRCQWACPTEQAARFPPMRYPRHPTPDPTSSPHQPPWTRRPQLPGTSEQILVTTRVQAQSRRSPGEPCLRRRCPLRAGRRPSGRGRQCHPPRLVRQTRPAPLPAMLRRRPVRPADAAQVWAWPAAQPQTVPWKRPGQPGRGQLPSEQRWSRPWRAPPAGPPAAPAHRRTSAAPLGAPPPTNLAPQVSVCLLAARVTTCGSAGAWQQFA
mmetsp:Transcript_9916/g.29781  ORF Transcript_9916/g.29781 Transcript_9916/m.29781 type:complete len:258 (-) Transcript_9916:2057-2830(-)